MLYLPHYCCPKSSAAHDRADKRLCHCYLTKTPSPCINYNLIVSFQYKIVTRQGLRVQNRSWGKCLLSWFVFSPGLLFRKSKFL